MLVYNKQIIGLCFFGSFPFSCQWRFECGRVTTICWLCKVRNMRRRYTMITSGEPRIMWEEARTVWCKISFWHFAALNGKVTEICHSSQKFLLNAEEGNILFILNILACELNLNSDTSGSSGRMLTGQFDRF